MTKRIYLVFCLMVFAVAVKAQTPPRLTLQEAVELALKNNFNIRLSQNNVAIAKNNVTPGNAGMLPVVTGDFGTNNSRLNTRQVRSTGTTNLNARNSTYNYGVGLDWTIFDGFAMFANYDQLKQQEKLGNLSLQDTVQRTVANVISTYYNLISQDAQIKAQNGVLATSRIQAKIANDKYQAGSASRLELNTALVNANLDTANLINQIQQFKYTKLQLNQLLMRDLQTDFVVSDTILVDETLKLGDILNKAQTQNPAILASQINQRLAEINLKQVRATRYPVVAVNSGYTVNDSKTPAGFTLSQNTKGFSYGLSATLNIFDGFNQWRRERNAKLQIDNAAIKQKLVQQDIEVTISNFYITILSGST
jgi:outer membrane protein